MQCVETLNRLLVQDPYFAQLYEEQDIFQLKAGKTGEILAEFQKALEAGFNIFSIDSAGLGGQTAVLFEKMRLSGKDFELAIISPRQPVVVCPSSKLCPATVFLEPQPFKEELLVDGVIVDIFSCSFCPQAFKIKDNGNTFTVFAYCSHLALNKGDKVRVLGEQTGENTLIVKDQSHGIMLM